MIILGLVALVWAAPVGLRHLLLTPLPTRIYYCVLLLGGIALFVGGTWFLVARSVDRIVVFSVCASALMLALNQATGLAFSSIQAGPAGITNSAAS